MQEYAAVVNQHDDSPTSRTLVFHSFKWWIIPFSRPYQLNPSRPFTPYVYFLSRYTHLPITSIAPLRKPHAPLTVLQYTLFLPEKCRVKITVNQNAVLRALCWLVVPTVWVNIGVSFPYLVWYVNIFPKQRMGIRRTTIWSGRMGLKRGINTMLIRFSYDRPGPVFLSLYYSIYLLLTSILPCCPKQLLFMICVIYVKSK